MIQHLHAPTFAHPLTDDGTDTAHSDDTEHLAFRVSRRRQSRLPVARPHVLLGLVKLTERSQDEVACCRSGGVIDGARGMRDLDRKGFRMNDIDGVVAGTVVTDELDRGREEVEEGFVELWN